MRRLWNESRDHRLAAMLVCGVLLFAFGASRLLDGSVPAIVDALRHAGESTQTAGADQ